MDTDIFLAWRDVYSVGNEELDSQHKQMLRLITELHHALDRGQTELELRRLIQEACDYAKFHFKTEESLLTSCNYPGLPEHRRVHQEYVNQVESIRRLSDLALQEMAYKLFFYLKEWWLSHITKTDQEYAACLKSWTGAKQSSATMD